MLIEPTTSAAAYSVRLKAGNTIQVRGTLAGETITINIPDGAGGWIPLVEEGVAVVLDSNNLQQTTVGNTIVQISKPVTTNAVGIKIV